MGSIEQGERGQVVDAQELKTFGAEELRAVLARVGIGADHVRYDATAHRLAYRTLGPKGEILTATGLVVLPVDVDVELPVVSWTHGTIPTRAVAASMLTAFDVVPISASFAADGFAVTFADYVGMGGGDGYHPYMQAATEGTAPLDLLAAARTYAKEQGVTLSGDVYASGFSQGGSSALALTEAIHNEAPAWLRLKASAPLAGVFDIATWARDCFDPDLITPSAGVYYLAYLLTKYNATYGIYDSPGEVFNDPWATTVEELYNDEHSAEEIHAGLPGTPQELIKPAVVSELRALSGRFAEAFAANQIGNFAARVPVRLYVAGADDHVPANQGEECRDRIVAAGGQAEIVDVGPVDHEHGAIAGVPLIHEWFRSLAGKDVA